MVSDRVYNWRKQSTDVTSELAKNPSQCPLKVFKRLYESHDHPLSSKDSAESVNTSSNQDSVGQEKPQLRNALACGNWGSSVPSELFIKVRYIKHCNVGANKRGDLG